MAMAAQDETQDKKEDGHKVIRLKKVMKPMIMTMICWRMTQRTTWMMNWKMIYPWQD